MNGSSDLSSFFAGFFFLVLVAFDAVPFGAGVAALGLSDMGLGLSTARAGSAAASANAPAAIKVAKRNEDAVMDTLLRPERLAQSNDSRAANNPTRFTP